MRLTICLLAAAALCACAKSADVPPADNAADGNAAADLNGVDANVAATPAAFQINGTTWTFTDNGDAVTESIDEGGNYIANAGAKHLDHGTVVMKDGKACFTSAMNKDGEECWTTASTEIGQSMETVSDKGKKLTVTRVAYEALTMPGA